MSAKVKDDRNRWRNKSVAFRASPEEALLIDRLARTSGMSKQEYLIARASDQTITIHGSPRVYKALKNTITDMLKELRELEGLSPEPEFYEALTYFAKIVEGFEKNPEKS